MKITSQPSGALSIRVVPWAVWAAGGALVVLSLIMMFVFGAAQTVTLECRRVEAGQIDCALTRSILGSQQSMTAIRGLQGASVYRSSSSRGGWTYRVDIAARSGSASLTSYTSSGFQDKQAIADRINRFVADEHAPYLTLSHIDWLLIMFGLILLAVGVLISPLMTPVTIWTFDRMTGALAIQKINALGHKTTVVALNQIRSAKVELSRSSSTTKSTRSSRVVLRLVSGEQVALTSYFDGLGLRAKQEAVQQIRSFLGLSSAPDPADDAEALFQRGMQAYVSNLFGGKATAARLFHQVTQLDPNRQQAWMLLAASVVNAGEKRGYLERAIAIDSTSADGRRAADELQRLSGVAATAAIRAAAQTPPFEPALASSGARAKTASIRAIPGRLLGVVLFQSTVYRQIADDTTATLSAGAIVLVAAALVGFIGGMTSESFPVNGRALPPGPFHGIVRALVEVCAGLVNWIVGSAVGAFVATRFLRGRTSIAEMLRVLGYTNVFRVLLALPGGLALSWLLPVCGMVIGVREAAEFNTRKAVGTAAVAWGVAFAVSGITWLILSAAFTAAFG